MLAAFNIHGSGCRILGKILHIWWSSIPNKFSRSENATVAQKPKLLLKARFQARIHTGFHRFTVSVRYFRITQKIQKGDLSNKKIHNISFRVHGL